MNNFLDRSQVSKFKQNQINHLNSPTTPKEIEAVIDSLPNKRSLVPYGFSVEFYQIIKGISKVLTLVLFKLLHKIETEGRLPNLCYECTITLIPKPHKVPTKKNFRPISCMNKILAR